MIGGSITQSDRATREIDRLTMQIDVDCGSDLLLVNSHLTR